MKAKINLILLMAFSLSLLTVSCKKDKNKDDDQPEEENTVLTGVLSADKTLTADKIWFIDKRFVVPDGKKLTIEPGTIIKGKPGSGADASVLIVARGGKIFANGTEANPIVFTAEADNIDVGQKFGTNLSEDDNGLWGGVIILGKAKGSFENDVNEFSIEGIPASDPNGKYGGNDDADNSGVFKYVSIRHGGSEIGAGNEINGLSLGCVGSGTEIHHIEIVGNKDDGIEHFGGAVHESELLIFACNDDGLDIDQAYHGEITNSVVIKGANSDSGLEIDGGEGSLQLPFQMSNVTLIGFSSNLNKYADFRHGAIGTVQDIYAYGFPSGAKIRLKHDETAQNYNNNVLVFQNWQIALPAGVNKTDLPDNHTNIPAPNFEDASFINPVQQGSQTVGADLNQFNWTYAKHKNAF